jgi:F-type H+-transporting ATPase subunit b
MLFQFLAEAAAHGEDHGPTLLGLSAEGWVYVGVTLFFLIAIFGAKAHKQVLGALDAQIAETRRSLDEAASIRVEAETILADAKAQQAASAKDAMALLDHAKDEAAAIVAKAEADTAALVARREKMAQDKIGAAERAAVDGLKARAAAAATGAARQLIAANHNAKADKSLVDEAIAGL